MFFSVKKSFHMYSEGKLQVEYGCMKKIRSTNIININVRGIVNLTAAITNTRMVFLHQEVILTCTGTPDGHLLAVTIPDAVLIQFELLRMSKILLETCRGL